MEELCSRVLDYFDEFRVSHVGESLTDISLKYYEEEVTYNLIGLLGYNFMSYVKPIVVASDSTIGVYFYDISEFKFDSLFNLMETHKDKLEEVI